MRRTATCFALGLALLAGLPSAHAQDDEFDAAIDRAMKAYRAKKYAEAIEDFELAYEIRSEPELVYNVARAYEKSLQSAKAIEAYERFLSLPGTTASLRAKARASLEALRREEAAKNAPPPTVTTLPPPTAGDRAPPPQVVRTEPAPAKTVEYVLIGAGATAVVVGTIFGVLALSKNGDFGDAKDRGEDTAVLNGLKDDVDSNALIADIAILSGLVLGGVGVALLVAGGDDAEGVAVSPTVGADGGGLAVTGRF